MNKQIFIGKMNMKYIDLSHTITPDLPTWPGDVFSLKQIVKYGFVADNILHSSMHIGTHIDVSIHMIEGGKSLSEYPPEKFIGRGVLIDARDRDIVDVDLLDDVDIKSDDIVFILTGHDKLFGKPAYFENYPVLTENFAHELVKKEVKIVGVDSPSPDKQPFPVHKILLANDVLIIEMLTNLDQLRGMKDFSVIALPPKFDTAGSFVRVVACTK